MSQSPATSVGAPRPGHLRHVRRARRLPRHPRGRRRRWSAGCRAGDADRLALVANYYENVLSFLHAHHKGEEEVVFPLLRKRCPEGERAGRRAGGTARGGDGPAGPARQWLAAWPGGGDAVQLEVVGALGSLRTHLNEHLEEEERLGLPLAAEYLSAEEWGALPGHGLRAFDGDKVWLILGLIRERMNEAQREGMLDHMPPPVVAMWTGFGEHAFMELAAEVWWRC